MNSTTANNGLDLVGLFSWDRRGQRLIQVKEGKAAPVMEVSATEIASFPYVVVNKWHYPFVLVDVDEPRYDDKAEAFDPGFFDGLGLPLPNTVTVSGRGYHVLWALEYPLARHGKGMPYYRYIRTVYNAAMNGDFSCAATAATRNPFYVGGNAVCFGSWRRELAKLDIPFKGGKPGFRVHSTAYIQGNRNTATFLHALAVYKANPGMDFERLLECAESFQMGQSAPPLSRAENTGIVASILRNGGRYSLGNPNRGRLGLEPREGFLPLEEFREWKAERQAMGCE